MKSMDAIRCWFWAQIAFFVAMSPEIRRRDAPELGLRAGQLIRFGRMYDETRQPPKAEDVEAAVQFIGALAAQMSPESLAVFESSTELVLDIGQGPRDGRLSSCWTEAQTIIAKWRKVGERFGIGAAHAN